MKHFKKGFMTTLGVFAGMVFYSAVVKMGDALSGKSDAPKDEVGKNVSEEKVSNETTETE